MKDIARDVRLLGEKESENLRPIFDAVASTLETGLDAQGNPVDYNEFAK